MSPSEADLAAQLENLRNYKECAEKEIKALTERLIDEDYLKADFISYRKATDFNIAQLHKTCAEHYAKLLKAEEKIKELQKDK